MLRFLSNFGPEVFKKLFSNVIEEKYIKIQVLCFKGHMAYRTLKKLFEKIKDICIRIFKKYTLSIQDVIKNNQKCMNCWQEFIGKIY